MGGRRKVAAEQRDQNDLDEDMLGWFLSLGRTLVSALWFFQQ